MPLEKKRATKKILEKRTASTVVVVRKRIVAKDTLFPEKVAKAKKILVHSEGL
jgi:hypothetical protein